MRELIPRPGTLVGDSRRRAGLARETSGAARGSILRSPARFLSSISLSLSLSLGIAPVIFKIPARYPRVMEIVGELGASDRGLEIQLC
jgi:hypothetical protein